MCVRSQLIGEVWRPLVNRHTETEGCHVTLDLSCSLTPPAPASHTHTHTLLPSVVMVWNPPTPRGGLCVSAPELIRKSVPWDQSLRTAPRSFSRAAPPLWVQLWPPLPHTPSFCAAFAKYWYSFKKNKEEKSRIYHCKLSDERPNLWRMLSFSLWSRFLSNDNNNNNNIQDLKCI